MGPHCVRVRAIPDHDSRLCGASAPVVAPGGLILIEGFGEENPQRTVLPPRSILDACLPPSKTFAFSNIKMWSQSPTGVAPSHGAWCAWLPKNGHRREDRPTRRCAGSRRVECGAGEHDGCLDPSLQMLRGIAFRGGLSSWHIWGSIGRDCGAILRVAPLTEGRSDVRTDRNSHRGRRSGWAFARLSFGAARASACHSRACPDRRKLEERALGFIDVPIPELEHSLLAGYGYQSNDPNGFVHKDEVVRFLEDYARFIKAPIRCGVRVASVRQRSQSPRFVVEFKRWHVRS